MNITQLQSVGDENNIKPGEFAQDEVSVIQPLLRQAILSKATSLARIGRYDEAEALVSSLYEDALAFDLLARIRAQQGRLMEAEEQWQKAVRQEPVNDSYRTALHRISKMQKHPAWMALTSRLILSAILVLVVIVGWVAIRNYHDAIKSLPNTSRDLVPGQQATMSMTPKAAPSDLNINIPGVSVKIEAERFIAIFDNGLFASSSRLKPEAKELLTELGRRLEPKADRILVRIMGYTDNMPVLFGTRYSDNDSLSMSRAIAVYNHLKETTDLPSSIFSVGSGAELRSPYPNDTPHNRARNRTVIFSISESAQ